MLSEGKIMALFSASNLKGFISVRLVWRSELMLWLSTSGLRLGESISPHTKEDLGKKMSFHYMFQLFSIYTSVTFIAHLACLLHLSS